MRYRAQFAQSATSPPSRPSLRWRPDILSRRTGSPDLTDGFYSAFPFVRQGDFTMKTLFRYLAVVAAAAAALMAAPAHAAKDVVFAVASTFTTTDPYDANDTLSQAMAKSFYEGLYGFDKDMKMIPVLAESYTVSPDGLVYTVKLKKGIKFHDGTDFKADAVKANFDRVTNPDNKLKRYGLYSNIGK